MAEIEVDADEFVAVNPGEVAFGDGGFDVGLDFGEAGQVGFAGGEGLFVEGFEVDGAEGADVLGESAIPVNKGALGDVEIGGAARMMAGPLPGPLPRTKLWLPPAVGVRRPDHSGFQRHMVRFQLRDQVAEVGDFSPEVILANSHDRSGGCRTQRLPLAQMRGLEPRQGRSRKSPPLFRAARAPPLTRQRVAPFRTSGLFPLRSAFTLRGLSGRRKGGWI